MKYLIRIILFLATALAVLPAYCASRIPPFNGELLIKSRKTAQQGFNYQFHRRLGMELVRDYPAVGWQLVKSPKGMTFHSAAARYRKSPEILAVSENFRCKISAMPNDPSFSRLWGLQAIRAPEAWNISTGSSQVIVAVLDTGIDYQHADLLTNIWRNQEEIAGNGIDDDNNGYIDDIYGIDSYQRDSDPFDQNGHGTHVSGIIGASGNNGLGVVGVNWTTEIMALRFLDSSGSGAISDAIEGYDYAITMKRRGVNIRVINNSWSSGSAPLALLDAITRAGEVGILSICAAGNGGNDEVGDDISILPDYPAAFSSPYIISVAAADSNNQRALFSNFGTPVHLAAPGVSILSTYLSGQYKSISGTSMATPYVSGAAALLCAAKMDANSTAIKNALLNNVDISSAWSRLVSSGGTLNLYKALSSIAPPIIVPGTPGHFQADLKIRRSGDAAFLGDNIYLQLAQQTIIDSFQSGTKKNYEIMLENDGDQATSFVLKGNAQIKGWKVNYFNARVGGKNISTAVTKNGWLSPVLSPGAQQWLRIELSANRKTFLSAIFLPNQNWIDITLNAASSRDLTQKDSVAVNAMIADIK